MTSFHHTAAGRNLAYDHVAGTSASIIFLGGFRSDMTGTKAAHLAAWAAKTDMDFLRFDYSGHGQSSGDFRDGCISDWCADGADIIRARAKPPYILVGSSMGGWIALLVARAMGAEEASQRIAGMVLIAPAVDFTEVLMWEKMGSDTRREIVEKGVWMRQSAYAPEPYPVTRALIEDGRRNLLLGGVIEAHAPVHILQGGKDPDVPWQHAMTLVEHLAGDCVTVTLIKDGDHRLSRDQDIALLLAAVGTVA